MSQWFAQTLHYDWTLTAPPIVSREAGLSADMIKTDVLMDIGNESDQVS
jgi:hypothetical protein